jgi:hypothetical protein
VTTFTPLLGAELALAPGARLELRVDPSFEHGLLADTDGIQLDETALARADLGYAGPGRSTLVVANTSAQPGRAVLLGGPPFTEEIVMWWNFVGRSHEDIEVARAEWQAHSDRFGEVRGYAGPVQHLPAPQLPQVRIRPRSNPSAPRPQAG